MKDIKDYLHLYLGCEICKADGSGNFKLTPHTLSQMNLPNTTPDIKKGKPILRPLSSMTEEELSAMESIYGFYASKPYAERLGTDAEVTRHLLSKGFDLFNLIPEGLAIDSTN